MKKFYIFAVVIFLGIWALGVALSFITGITRISRTSVEEEKKIAIQAEKEQKKFMEEYKFQLQKYKESQMNYPAQKNF